MKKSINLRGFWLPAISRHIIAPAQKMYTGDEGGLKKNLQSISYNKWLRKSMGHPARIPGSDLYLLPLFPGSVKISNHLDCKFLCRFGKDYAYTQYHLSKKLPCI